MIAAAVRQLTEQIVELCQPDEIWLYSRKLDLKEQTTSFKLCVVISGQEKEKIESTIYLTLDCPVPYDVTVYTGEEWAAAAKNPNSFARSILTKGHKLYGKTTLE